MSLAVSTACWIKSAATGTARLVLLAIADYADDDGAAFPSVDSLAKKCRMSKRNMQERLKSLIESGELTVLRNQGPPPKYPNIYRINLDVLGMQPTAPVQSTSPVKPSVERGEAQRTNGMKPTTPKQSLTVRNGQADGFEEFWEAYPQCFRKALQAECRSLWVANDLCNESEKIIADVRQKAMTSDWQKQNGQYVPAPFNYLRRKQWEQSGIATRDSVDDRLSRAV